jgi:hypothetical protein
MDQEQFANSEMIGVVLLRHPSTFFQISDQWFLQKDINDFGRILSIEHLVFGKRNGLLVSGCRPDKSGVDQIFKIRGV